MGSSTAVFLVRFSRQRIARFGETVPEQQTSKTFLLELRLSAELMCQMCGRYYSWELVTRNANKLVVVELQSYGDQPRTEGPLIPR